MTTKIIREKETSREEFIKQYAKQVEKVENFNNDVVELSEIQAKHEADVFIVADFKEGQAVPEMAQGDILMWKEGCKMYDKYINTVSNRQETESRNLQLGESVTGDHKVVPLKGANLVIENCTIEVQRGRGRDLSYPAKIITSDKAFCLVHREHGNMTFPAGTYMSCVSLNPKTMTRMLD